MTEIGNNMDWLLWNVTVQLISKCTAVILLLWIGCYEMWRWNLSLSVIQWYKTVMDCLLGNVTLSRASRQRLKCRCLSKVFLLGLWIPSFLTCCYCSVVGGREWVKGRIGGQGDIVGRGSLAQKGFLGVCRWILWKTGPGRLWVWMPGLHGTRGEDWLTEWFMPNCV